MSIRAWTDAHIKEAIRRTFELAIKSLDAGEIKRAARLANNADEFCRTESGYRLNLRSFGYLSGEDCDREINRVHKLATGHMVRKHGYSSGGAFSYTREGANRHGAPVRRCVRVVRVG